MDVALYTLISNSSLHSPLLETGSNLDRDTPIPSAKLDKIVDPRLKDVLTAFDSSAKYMRSVRLKVLTTKVYLIRDRKDADNLETIYAEDIFIPKHHAHATKSAFSIQ